MLRTCPQCLLIKHRTCVYPLFLLGFVISDPLGGIVEVGLTDPSSLQWRYALVFKQSTAPISPDKNHKYYAYVPLVFVFDVGLTRADDVFLSVCCGLRLSILWRFDFVLEERRVGFALLGNHVFRNGIHELARTLPVRPVCVLLRWFAKCDQLRD